jgi:hypothetical protein
VAVAESGPSLDVGKNNSTSPETAENGRYDCRDVYSNFEFENPDGETAAFRCGQWDCYCCGYRMKENLIEEIERITTARPEMSRLLTLTLNPDKAPSGAKEQHRYIGERWNALRTRLKREVGDFSFIWVREEQDNGMPHLHAIVSRYLPQSTVSAAWSDLGGGRIVDIQQVERVEKVAHYVGKYLTKDATSDLPDGTRRYGSSADFDLEVRGGGDSEQDWSLLMDDYVVTYDGDPLRREPTGGDFIAQRERGGPVGKGPPSD